MKHTLAVAFVLFVCVGLLSAQAPQGAPPGQQPVQQPGAPPAGAAPQGGRGGGRAALIPRINRFEVSRTSIKPGESVDLRWSVEAGDPTIDNGIGPVYQSGSIRITPKATTTYTLTMSADVRRSVTVTVAGTTPAAASAPASAPVPPAIARINGKPDFSGIYGFTGMSGFARGRGAAAAAPTPPPSPFANLPARPTLKPGVDNTPRPAPAGGTADCLPLPADTAFGVPYPFQIFQNPRYVIMINEYPGTFRIIPIDQPHRADAADDPTWMGDSVAQWDGDTLVIDTVGYNGKHAIGGIQEPSDRFHTIERLTRVNGKDIFYEIIYEDPEKAEGQWRSTRTFVGDTRPGVNKVLEFICENNRDYVPLFGPQGPPPPRQGGPGGPGAPPAAPRQGGPGGPQ
jgi:hypothetical protein